LLLVGRRRRRDSFFNDEYPIEVLSGSPRSITVPSLTGYVVGVTLAELDALIWRSASRLFGAGGRIPLIRALEQAVTPTITAANSKVPEAFGFVRRAEVGNCEFEVGAGEAEGRHRT
jgi:hypothetical protein